jgi:hypothetical protein
MADITYYPMPIPSVHAYDLDGGELDVELLSDGNLLIHTERNEVQLSVMELTAIVIWFGEQLRLQPIPKA